MKDQAFDVVVKLRALQMAYTHIHHHVKGCSFFADHGAAATFYEAAAGDADAASERLIGLFGSEALNLDYFQKASELVKDLGQGKNNELWMAALVMEKDLIKSIEELCKELPRESDKQLYSGISDKAVSRTYLLKQRLKED